MMSTPYRPLIALTMGDVAGIGPEVVALAVTDAAVHQMCRPVVVGDPDVLQRALRLCGQEASVVAVTQSDLVPVTQSSTGSHIPCWNPTAVDVRDVAPGAVAASAGAAAHDWLVSATSAALAGEIDAIVTAPLNKAALHAGGYHYPGHTEILAERCGVADFAMMLYLPPGDIVAGPHGLGIAHVTLHTSLASVPNLLSMAGIREKIGLMHDFLRSLGAESPRIGVCALNPHGGEQGLFGDEEARLIRPAVDAAWATGINVAGPLPTDTLIQRAVSGAYDGLVAMYHDQGHIALKLIGFQQAVNITLGLPIVRTSPSHGTAFDIAWSGQADALGMKTAIGIAVKLAMHHNIR